MVRQVFNFGRILALFGAPRTPYDAALRELAHGRPQAALDALDALLDNETDRQRRAEIGNKRGVALIDLARREEAEEAFEFALACIPEFAPALVNLGNLRLESGDCDAAIAYYERALRSDRDLASAHRHLGLAYKRLGRNADAFRAFSRARRLEGRAGAKQRK